MNMNEYAQLLASFGIDVEKELDLYEKVLKKTQGQTRVFRSGAGLRVFRHEKDIKLLHYAEGYNFEKGLKDLAKNLNGQSSTYKNFQSKYLEGSPKHSSPIDEWILRGNTIDIKAEKANGGFTVNAGDNNPDRNKKQIFEVNAKKLITAFEMFRRDLIDENQLAKKPANHISAEKIRMNPLDRYTRAARDENLLETKTL